MALSPTIQSRRDDVSPRVEPTTDYGRDRSEGRNRVGADALSIRKSATGAILAGRPT